MESQTEFNSTLPVNAENLAYRTDGLQDSFGNLSFRIVLTEVFPGCPEPDALVNGGKDNIITHLTGHQLAIVDLKVSTAVRRSCVVAEDGFGLAAQHK